MMLLVLVLAVGGEIAEPPLALDALELPLSLAVRVSRTASHSTAQAVTNRILMCETGRDV